MTAYDVVKSVFGTDIPVDVLSEPRYLGIFYIPPSGIANGGRPQNNQVLNLNRALFDEWLRNIAESFGVHISYGTKLIKFIGHRPVKVKVSYFDGDTKNVSTNYLIGADGVYSGVRTQLYGGKHRVMRIAQESWKKTENIDDFYIILDDIFSCTYSYVIPKAEIIEIGLCLTDDELKQYSNRMESLKARLKSTLNLRFNTFITKSLWSIPYGFIKLGEGNILLVGDAAGLCNPVTGEGIRLGVESGEVAGLAVGEAIEKDADAISLYSNYASKLVQLVFRSYLYSLKLDNSEKEKFVAHAIKDS
jgi:flavin-dependent dehydrogenase